MNLSIVTPSFINSRKRYFYSKKSFDSLTENLGFDYPIIVVDDVPRINSYFRIPNPKLFNLAPKIYASNKNVIFKRRYGKGSKSALVESLHLAKAHKYNLVFIHLDDNIYVPKLKELLKHSIEAFKSDAELNEIRLTGRPILSNFCNENVGNISFLDINQNTVSFGKNEFVAKNFTNFTLWSSYYHEDMVDGYWPIAMWSTIYRTEFLESLLKNPNIDSCLHLSQVESYYVNKENFSRELKAGVIRGKIGYINMQFCGLEMQHNGNWSDLIKYPNLEVKY